MGFTQARVFGFILSAACCCGWMVGCAQWDSRPILDESNEGQSAKRGLPEVRAADSSAILEVAFPTLDELWNYDHGLEAPWQHVDETVVAPETRQWLTGNGLRIGRIEGWDAAAWQPQTTPDDPARLLKEANVWGDFESKRRQITVRPGQTYTLMVRREMQEDVSTLLALPNGDVVGRTVSNPSFAIRIRSYTLDDGRLVLRLVPEIQHGEVKPNYVANESLAFRVDYRRQTWALDMAPIEVPLSAGQAIVLAPTEELFGFGEKMLVGRRADGGQQKVAVVIQLARPPLDTNAL